MNDAGFTKPQITSISPEYVVLSVNFKMLDTERVEKDEITCRLVNVYAHFIVDKCSQICRWV